MNNFLNLQTTHRNSPMIYFISHSNNLSKECSHSQGLVVQGMKDSCSIGEVLEGA